MPLWNDHTPIYLQLKSHLVDMMLDGLIKPKEALPSVRQIASDYQINPITVSRAYQELVDENLIEKRRGVGMYMNELAREQLLKTEQTRFLTIEWPAIQTKLKRLNIDPSALLKGDTL